MPADRRTPPPPVVQVGEDCIFSELAEADRDGRKPLTGDGVYRLHDAIAAAYEIGYRDGENAERIRGRGRRDRGE